MEFSYLIRPISVPPAHGDNSEHNRVERRLADKIPVETIYTRRPKNGIRSNSITTPLRQSTSGETHNNENSAGPCCVVWRKRWDGPEEKAELSCHTSKKGQRSSVSAHETAKMPPARPPSSRGQRAGRAGLVVSSDRVLRARLPGCDDGPPAG